jgi:hypothetical protein
MPKMLKRNTIVFAETKSAAGALGSLLKAFKVEVTYWMIADVNLAKYQLWGRSAEYTTQMKILVDVRWTRHDP